MNLLAIGALSGDFPRRDKFGADLFHKLLRFAEHVGATVQARIDVRTVSPTRMGEHVDVLLSEGSDHEIDSDLFGAFLRFFRAVVKRSNHVESDNFEPLIFKHASGQNAV